MGGEYNKTQLDPRTYVRRQILHRDILAHHLRWTHVAKYWVKLRKTGRVLDVGCGKGCPLAWALYANKCAPETYVGTELRPMVKRSEVGTGSVTDVLRERGEVPDKDWVVVHDGIDAVNVEAMENMHQTYGPFDAVVCFELIEHMPREAGLKLLEALHAVCLNEKGAKTRLFLSTPVYDGEHMAGNHIYEWQYKELADALVAAGFVVEARFGTFASQKDVVRAMKETNPGWLELFASLREYYDSNYLATVFAPLFPAYSRNVLWRCVRR